MDKSLLTRPVAARISERIENDDASERGKEGKKAVTSHAHSKVRDCRAAARGGKAARIAADLDRNVAIKASRHSKGVAKAMAGR